MLFSTKGLSKNASSVTSWDQFNYPFLHQRELQAPYNIGKTGTNYSHSHQIVLEARRGVVKRGDIRLAVLNSLGFGSVFNEKLDM